MDLDERVNELLASMEQAADRISARGEARRRRENGGEDDAPAPDAELSDAGGKDEFGDLDQYSDAADASHAEGEADADAPVMDAQAAAEQAAALLDRIGDLADTLAEDAAAEAAQSAAPTVDEADDPSAAAASAQPDGSDAAPDADDPSDPAPGEPPPEGAIESLDEELSRLTESLMAEEQVFGAPDDLPQDADDAPEQVPPPPRPARAESKPNAAQANDDAGDPAGPETAETAGQDDAAPADSEASAPEAPARPKVIVPAIDVGAVVAACRNWTFPGWGPFARLVGIAVLQVLAAAVLLLNALFDRRFGSYRTFVGILGLWTLAMAGVVWGVVATRGPDHPAPTAEPVGLVEAE